MEYAASLRNVSSAIKELFKEKGELRGIQEWDILIQCVMTLDSVAEELSHHTAETSKRSDDECQIDQ